MCENAETYPPQRRPHDVSNMHDKQTPPPYPAPHTHSHEQLKMRGMREVGEGEFRPLTNC